MRGRRVRLEPFSASMLPWLSDVIGEPANVGRWRVDRFSAPHRTVERLLWGASTESWQIMDRDYGQPVGVVQLYDVDTINRIAYLSMIVGGAYHLSGWPLEGALLVVLRAKQQLGLRKLYLEVPEMNLAQFKSIAAYTSEEARLSGCVRGPAGPSDLMIYAVDLDSVNDVVLEPLLGWRPGSLGSLSVRDLVGTGGGE